jgi:growth factor-regulated tyrosine kinase substrate
MPLPHYGIHQDVRVCLGCFLKLNPANNQSHTLSDKTKAQQHATSRQTSSHTAGQSSHTQHTSNQQHDDDEEDEDLKRAIELSLKEMRGRPAAPPPPLRPQVCWQMPWCFDIVH